MAATQHSRNVFVRGALLAAAATAAVVLLLAPTRAFVWLESGTYDARSRFASARHPADARIVILDVDNPSFDNLKEMLHRWPWTRAIWTEAVRYVNGGNPRVIVFDTLFEGAESDAIDAE